MAGFLYFVSGQNTLKPGDVARFGLGYAFADGKTTQRQTSGGSPSGKSGVVFADPARHEVKQVGFYPEQQTWRKLPKVEGRPELWVGYWNDANPGPGDLARVKQIRGVPLPLGDGNSWNIPIVRSFDGTRQEWASELPSAWVCDEEGNLVPGNEPKGIYAHLWELTAPLADAMLAIASGEAVDWVNDQQVGRTVAALLGTNYHVSAVEIAMLELIGGEEAFAVVAVASRFDTLQDWIDQKKTSDPSTASGATSSSGEAA